MRITGQGIQLVKQHTHAAHNRQVIFLGVLVQPRQLIVPDLLLSVAFLAGISLPRFTLLLVLRLERSEG